MDQREDERGNAQQDGKREDEAAGKEPTHGVARSYLYDVLVTFCRAS
jgi:hypothetical protein